MDDPTQAAPTQAAWSQEVLDYPETGPLPTMGAGWAPTVTFAGLMIAATAVAVTAAVTMTRRPSPPPQSSPATTVVVTETQTVPAAPPPTSQAPTSQIPATAASQDARYLALFAAESGLTITDPDVVILFGHQVCEELSRNTPAAEASLLYKHYNNLTKVGAWGVIDAASTVYCPQYKVAG